MGITFRILSRLFRIVRFRHGYIALRRWVFPSLRSLSAWRKRLRNGKLFPPFLFIALTDACNLRCHGCWIHAKPDRRELTEQDVQTIIEHGRSQHAGFYTLLGGEPFLWQSPRSAAMSDVIADAAMVNDAAIDTAGVVKHVVTSPAKSATDAFPKIGSCDELPIFRILRRNPDCYFQIITNGMFLDGENVRRLSACGNVTPLVSIDGFAESSDRRRGPNSFARAETGCRRLGEAGLLYGVATTITGQNLEEVLDDCYVQHWMELKAGYLWYYIYRPVGDDPSPEFAVPHEKMLQIRRRMLELRRKHAMVIIDTYWNAKGEALCPAALGMGFQINPDGAIGPCPPLAFARETIRDYGGDLVRAIDESQYLRDFSKFCTERTRGCVILEYPRELATFLRQQQVCDATGRDAIGELERSEPRSSHHLPGEEIPEDLLFYKLMKNRMFFGLGAYG
ncbi:MAG: radical SAM protein [Thermoguttaceae bacterium]|nr:radical SAM protein [Thermoguttaceae bacterium]